MRMANPPHPGLFIRDEILDAHELSVTGAAEVLGATRPTISKLLNGTGDLAPEMAWRIEKAFGVSMDMLLRMQVPYDIAQARKRSATINVARYVPESSVA